MRPPKVEAMIVQERAPTPLIFILNSTTTNFIELCSNFDSNDEIVLEHYEST